MLLIALASILYGSAMAFTRPRAADPRLLVGRPARLHRARDLLAARRGRPGRDAADGQPRPRRRARVLHRRAARRARRRLGGHARHGRPRASARRCSPTLFLIVALANLAMPGSSNFVGEFLILLGVFKAKIVIAIVAFTGVALASVYTLRLFIRAMHNRVGPARRLARDDARATGSCSCRSCSVILALARLPAGRAAPLRARGQGDVAPQATPARAAAEAARSRCSPPRPRPAHRLGGAVAAGRAARRRDASCCSLGLLRPRVVREAVVPGARDRRARRRARAGDLAVGRATRTSSPARCALDELALALTLIFCVAGDRGGAAVVARARAARGRPTASTTRCC